VTWLVLGALLTLGLLRLQAHHRGLRLEALRAQEHAQWLSLCRVTKYGHFLDRGRGRRGMGPRGTLVYNGDELEWRPDQYEQRHSDIPFVWPIALVECTNLRARRDVSGLPCTEVQLRVPEGAIIFGLFKEAGARPKFLLDRAAS
jgi:hypothetical protein